MSGSVEKEQKLKKKRSQAIEKNKPQKPAWLEYAQYGVELLKVHYPLCFKPINQVKPLKKGIKQDLIKHLSTRDDIVIADKACMVKSLTYYVNTAAYHKNVVEGQARIDLNGAHSSLVTAEEARYSIERFTSKRQIKTSSLAFDNKCVKEELP